MKDNDKKVVIGEGMKVPSINLDSVVGKDDVHISDKSRIVSSVSDASGAMIAKKLFKRNSRRNSERRGSSFFNSNQGHQTTAAQKMEPTYQLEPKNAFSACVVEKIIKQVLETRLDGKHYNPDECGMFSRMLTDEIKERVKALKYDRYKIVCYITIGENKGQGVMTTSRCAWDFQRDSYATYTVTTRELFCTACVFGVYAE